MGRSAEVEGALRPRHARHRHRRAARRRHDTSRRVPHRPRAGDLCRAFADHLRMVWLTPAMDSLFMGAASERRRFFDRLVLAIDAEHSAASRRSTARCAREIACWKTAIFDAHWLRRHRARNRGARRRRRRDSATRRSATAAGDAGGARPQLAFPSARIALDGWMECAAQRDGAGGRGTLSRDAARKPLPRRRRRPHIGRSAPDRPAVVYAPKNMPARDASTGEQKALLIGLVLAHAGLVAEMTGITPLLLLDESRGASRSPTPRRAVRGTRGSARRSG
jgi:DNA replication and repair protein RecF